MSTSVSAHKCYDCGDTLANMQSYDAGKTWRCTDCAKKNSPAYPVQPQPPMQHFIHPAGVCACAGKAQCAWCLMGAWRQRAERAEAEVAHLRRQALRVERVVLEGRLRKVSVVPRKSTTAAYDCMRLEQINEELGEDPIQEGENQYD